MQKVCMEVNATSCCWVARKSCSSVTKGCWVHKLPWQQLRKMHSHSLCQGQKAMPSIMGGSKSQIYQIYGCAYKHANER